MTFGHGTVLADSGGGVVIPNFGGSDSCVSNTNALFCPSWIREHWRDTLVPKLVQHLELTLIAVGIGFAIAFTAALIAHHYRLFETPFSIFAAFLYAFPSIALFQLIVPITGINWTTIEIGLVGYTLLILFRNTLTGLRGVPDDVLEAARGMGYTKMQILLRVELPLALPAIIAGVRTAVVTTISLATIAAYITPDGLGQLIFYSLQNPFNTEFIAAGVLIISLALTADGLLVLVQRRLTPWRRAKVT